MAEQAEGEVVLVSLSIGGGPAAVSQVIALEPNRLAALVPLADGAFLFDGHGRVVRVKARERGEAAWTSDLLKPPAAVHGKAVSDADGGALVAGQDVKGQVAVTVKFHADGALAWRWRSEEFVEGTHVAGLPDGGAALVARRWDGGEVLVRLTADGQEVFRKEIVGEVLQVRGRGHEVAVLAANKGALTLLSYDAQTGALQPVPLKLPNMAQATELRFGHGGWTVTGSWPGERDGATEIIPQAWVRSGDTHVDGLPLYRPRVVGSAWVVGVRGSRLDVCEMRRPAASTS